MIVLPRGYALTRRGLRGFGGVGDSAGSNIVNEFQQFANDPYLNSPAYLAAEAADGAPDLGPSGDALSTLNTYCALNAQDNAFFGDPLDTATCSGSQPVASVVAAAQALPAGPVLTGPTTTVTSPGPAILPVVRLANLSRPGMAFQAGDTIQVSISGSPNSPIANSATQNGQALGATPYGNTSSAGTATITAALAASDVGSWSETWSVGGINAAPISFSVLPGAAPAGSPSSSTPTSTVTSSGAAPGSSTPAGCFQPLAAYGLPDPCFGPIGGATLAAGLVVLIALGAMFGGKR